MNPNSIKIILRRIDGLMIPYDYNYYLAINFYEKLSLYSERIRKLHSKESFSLHTFSNIISKDVKSGINGLEIPSGFIIFRSLDSRLINYLRLGISIDPVLKIAGAKYVVQSIINWKELGELNSIVFKTLSPVVVRDFISKKYVEDTEDVPDNLLAVTEWQLKNLFRVSSPDLTINLRNIRRKTVRISSKESGINKTIGFEFEGNITADPRALKIIYYRGLGSKTGLGLGLIEVIRSEN